MSQLHIIPFYCQEIALYECTNSSFDMWNNVEENRLILSTAIISKTTTLDHH